MFTFYHLFINMHVYIYIYIYTIYVCMFSLCFHTQQSDNQIKRWWIMDGVTFRFETNIYIKKHVSNKPTTWNDVFSCPFLSLSQGTITYHIPILKVAGSRWFSSWSQGRGIGFQWPCCFAENQGVVFFPRSSDQTKRLTKLGYDACCFGPKLTPHQVWMYTHRIPMGLPYLHIFTYAFAKYI